MMNEWKSHLSAPLSKRDIKEKGSAKKLNQNSLKMLKYYKKYDIIMVKYE